MNPDAAPGLLASALQAAGRAAVWLATAIAIALTGLAAVLMALAALVLQTAGALLKALAELALAALPIVLALIPGLARLLCLAFALGATGYAGWRLAVGLGGDWLALGGCGCLRRSAPGAGVNVRKCHTFTGRAPLQSSQEQWPASCKTEREHKPACYTS